MFFSKLHYYLFLNSNLYKNSKVFIAACVWTTLMKQLKINREYDSVLSPLESDILKVMWPDKKLKVRQVYEKLKGKRTVALTSIAVILDRLHDKSIVERDVETGRGGLRYIYYPKTDKAEFEKSIVESTVNKLIARFGNTAVSYFNDRFSDKKR